MSRIFTYIVLPSLVRWILTLRPPSRDAVHVVRGIVSGAGRWIALKVMAVSLCLFAAVRLMLRFEPLLDAQTSSGVMNVVYAVILSICTYLILRPGENPKKTSEGNVLEIQDRESRELREKPPVLFEFLFSFANGYKNHFREISDQRKVKMSMEGSARISTGSINQFN